MTRMRLGIVALIAASVAVAGCGAKLSGKYEPVEDTGLVKLSVEFKGDKAYLTFLSTTSETEYEVNGDKVVFKNAGEKGTNLVMTLEKDGSLTGPLGMKLVKKG